MSVKLVLEFASEGWHVRWVTASTYEFEQTRQAFKETLSQRDRYWDEKAFGGKGGWWVSYGALSEVGYLFPNYRQLREDLEREHWQQYEHQRERARAQFRREQEGEGAGAGYARSGGGQRQWGTGVSIAAHN